MFVKVDGITSEADARLAIEAGADALGFVFAPSPRQVRAEAVRDIVANLPAEVVTLGVFVDEAPERVVDIVLAAGLQAAQLHGHESAEETRWVRARVGAVVKAFAAGDPAVLRAADHGADAVVVDHPGGGGGGGQGYDWSLAVGVPAGIRVVLAGGLTPGNVAAAIAAVHPWGVDVSSGVESSPGTKDAGKLRAFVDAARAAAPAPPDGWRRGGWFAPG
ncbi:MAG: phosphoribosylanthranilate isomerase [Acidimicrobiia bacterium]